jgi:sulfur-oxidizing protein SoxX
MCKINMVIATFFIVILTGCSQGVDSPQGFSLPKGDQVAGEQAFKDYNCSACHSIDGIDDTAITSELAKRVKIGHTSAKITTYAQLVTSIINPSHRVAKKTGIVTADENGESLMRNYNDIMTVTDLINIVAYLQPKYKVKPLTVSPYSTYYMMEIEKP